MSLRARFYLALLLSFLVIGLHIVATYLYLYWTLPGTDVFMHIIGGIMAGLYATVFLEAFRIKESWSRVLLLVFLVGLGWEALELIYHVALVDFWYWVDTVKDLVDDIIGGTIAYYIWRKI